MPHISFRRLSVAGIAFATAGVLTLAGCSTPGGSDASESPDDLGQCGTVPQLGAQDPDNLLAGFSDDVQAAYNGYPYAIQESAWADWKPSHEAPYTAAIVGMPPVSDFIKTMLSTLESELAKADIEVISNTAPDDPSNVPLQLQQFSQAVAQKPDIIFYVAIAPEPSVQAVAEAGAAGIPVISLQTAVDSPYSVSLTLNAVLQSMEVTSRIAKAIDGSGTVLAVNGIPGISTQVDAESAWEQVLKVCPDIKIAGQVNGLFVPTTAQTAVQQYLATNPAGVDAIFQAGTMGLGSLNAYLQADEDPVPIGDVGATQGFAAWALEHPDYPYVGTPSPAQREGEVGVEIALRMLAGDGIKVNQLVWNPTVIDSSNLKDFADSSWKPTDGTALAPDEGDFFPAETLDQYFASKN